MPAAIAPMAVRMAGCVYALFDENRRKPNFKNRIEEVIEKAVCALAPTNYYGRPWRSSERHPGDLRHSNRQRIREIFLLISPTRLNILQIVRSCYMRNR